MHRVPCTQAWGRSRAVASAPGGWGGGRLAQPRSAAQDGTQEEVAYRAGDLHPDVCAVQRGVASLSGPLGSLQPLLVFPAPHGEREHVPAWPPPLPHLVAVSILLLGRGKKAGHGRGPSAIPNPCSPARDPKKGEQQPSLPDSRLSSQGSERGGREGLVVQRGRAGRWRSCK